MADEKITICYARTGGAAGALDAIDGDDISAATQDVAFVFESDILYVYQCDPNSGAGESGFLIIAPDSNPGNKRWILIAEYYAYNHNARHERAGSDEIDGDHLDIDFTPANYTPNTDPAEAADVDDLAAHLKGVDTALGSDPILDKASPGNIGLTAPGLIRGKIDTMTQAGTDTLTAAEVSGTIISNRGQSEANTQTLPAAAEGYNGLVTIATAGQGAFHFKAGGGDKIYLDGTALDDGDKVSLATPALGDYFTFFIFESGSGTWDWIVQTGQGELTDGGA